jgi:aspartate carbamoyltransferase regulatory subunit
MPLDPEKIARLLAKKNAPKVRRSKNAPDTSIRDMETWFKLQTRMMNNETKELLKCENPNCVDKRHKGILVAEVNGQFMCRYCFLDGWLNEGANPDQVRIDA